MLLLAIESSLGTDGGEGDSCSSNSKGAATCGAEASASDKKAMPISAMDIEAAWNLGRIKYVAS
eukprot:CAMPEP_0169349026 /NCGR_PEP_ID=MMETSP1017-20121227/23492_1 /TAXON_ID=342587 /ORGANISM="Karlodinium micrum, Strain CCMP2283" /LENGTH=63 /DNA_ID=CAMNT_0009445125 /DNA_START=378 /DNA_END=569 /DNA_ORIENTATION=+